MSGHQLISFTKSFHLNNSILRNPLLHHESIQQLRTHRTKRESPYFPLRTVPKTPRCLLRLWSFLLIQVRSYNGRQRHQKNVPNERRCLEEKGSQEISSSEQDIEQDEGILLTQLNVNVIPPV